MRTVFLSLFTLQAILHGASADSDAAAAEDPIDANVAVENLDGFSEEQIAAVDMDGDGVVTGSEARFVEIDVDVSGYIDPDELLDFVIDLLDDPTAPDITEDDVWSVLELIDNDGDELVSFKEFLDSQHLGIMPDDMDAEEVSAGKHWLSIDEVKGRKGRIYSVISMCVLLPYSSGAKIGSADLSSPKHVVAITDILPGGLKSGLRDGTRWNEHIFHSMSYMKLLRDVKGMEEQRKEDVPDENREEKLREWESLKPLMQHMKTVFSVRNDEAKENGVNFDPFEESDTAHSFFKFNAQRTNFEDFKEGIRTDEFGSEKNWRSVFSKISEACFGGEQCSILVPQLPGRAKADDWAFRKAHFQTVVENEAINSAGEELIESKIEIEEEKLAELMEEKVKEKLALFKIFSLVTAGAEETADAAVVSAAETARIALLPDALKTIDRDAHPEYFFESGKVPASVMQAFENKLETLETLIYRLEAEGEAETESHIAYEWEQEKEEGTSLEDRLADDLFDQMGDNFGEPENLSESAKIADNGEETNAQKNARIAAEWATHPYLPIQSDDMNVLFALKKEALREAMFVSSLQQVMALGIHAEAHAVYRALEVPTNELEEDEVFDVESPVWKMAEKFHPDFQGENSEDLAALKSRHRESTEKYGINRDQ